MASKAKRGRRTATGGLGWNGWIAEDLLSRPTLSLQLRLGQCSRPHMVKERGKARSLVGGSEARRGP
ncbi:hypothetical protein WJX82_004337 [Trebouxia sp. C0006]